MLDTSIYERCNGKDVLESWNDIYSAYSFLSSCNQQWIFRGHESTEQPLQTTLERAIVHFGRTSEPSQQDDAEKHKQATKVLRKGLKGYKERRSAICIEGALLRKFKRQCYNYATDLPDDSQTMEWFALMRHYGTPTRLLDWTYSFFVALFFAMEKAEGEAAVWALDTDWLNERMKVVNPAGVRLFEKDPHVGQATFEKIFLQNPKLGVYAVNPFRRNERLAVQQGLFLCPGKVNVPFESNLIAVLGKGHGINAFYKLRIAVDVPERNNILRHLQRMNVSRAALFPGLEGFARSLITSLAHPDSLVVESNWKKYV